MVNNEEININENNVENENKKVISDNEYKGITNNKFTDGFIIGTIAAVLTYSFSTTIPQLFDKNKDHVCTLITIKDGDVNVFDNIKKNDFSKSKYSYQKISDTMCYIYVYGSDAPTYADFILSNIYFGDNNKIIFDENNVTSDNFEYYVLHEDEITRKRKG